MSAKGSVDLDDPFYHFLRESKMQIKKVVIAIQARSTSRRFPRKVYELIAGKPMLSHVVERCKESQKYQNAFTHMNGIGVHVVVLCPWDDPIKKDFGNQYQIIEGPEDDVLGRYQLCAEKLSADYIVRITSDCPLISPYVITKMIKVATINEADYVSNVFPEVRTVCDGHDCEVISARALKWAHENAKDPRDREHVTTFIRHSAPANEFRILHVIGHQNLSRIKLSVDTPEDLERVREEFETLEKCKKAAERMHGKHSIHRF